MENSTPQGFVLSREHKITLLKWLRQGYIDKKELWGLSCEVDNSTTLEELKEELLRLELAMSDEICTQFISHNVCKWCYSDGRPRPEPLPIQ